MITIKMKKNKYYKIVHTIVLIHVQNEFQIQAGKINHKKNKTKTRKVKFKSIP